MIPVIFSQNEVQRVLKILTFLCDMGDYSAPFYVRKK